MDRTTSKNRFSVQCDGRSVMAAVDTKKQVYNKRDTMRMAGLVKVK